LEQARAAARRCDWFFILGLSFPFSERDVLKARRELQRRAHQDKGGSVELSQLINLAADELLGILRPDAAERRNRQDCEDELQRGREDARRREEEHRKRREEGMRRLEEKERAQRTHSLLETVRVAHYRGGSKRVTAYLSMHAGRAFPAARKRVQELRKRRGGATRACALAYAVEREIAARRAAREDRWPKTVGLERRQPEKSKALAALKRQYDRAYQQLRHLRRTGQLHVHALLATRRLLGEAWMILLSLPPPLQEGGDPGELPVALSDAPEDVAARVPAI